MTRQLDPDQLPGTEGGDGLICAECVHGGIADDWCECVADGADIQQCRGPCRQRAHTPDRCPFRDAYVPLPIRWSQVRPGDTIRARENDTLMHVTGAGQDGDHWRLDVQVGYVNRTLISRNPDYPVPVLVPYAERAALLTLRAGGVRPTILERP